MSEIPDHIWEAAKGIARKVVFEASGELTPESLPVSTAPIAAALLAAEQFGREMEREACARIADAYAECERDCGDVIAFAIRSRSEEPKP
jgi:hypothetical protein